LMTLILGDQATTSVERLPWLANIRMQNHKKSSLQFQNLCTKMLLLTEAGEKQIITITSEEKGDGKTFIVRHLAKSLVALDLNVLIVDLNLINPSIGEQFEIQINYTLTDVLHKHVAIHEAIQITAIPNLDILAAGQLPFGINSLIATNRIGKILTELKEHYDYIIIDSADTTNAMDAIPSMKLGNITLYIAKEKCDEQFVLDKVFKIKTSYNIENVFFLSNNFKHSKKSGQVRPASKNLEKSKDIVVTKRPFLKRVALWFY
jgi:tyrosine-protein kinase Etk/Wzc